MPLIIGGAVFGVLALGLGFGTFQSVSAFSENEESLAKQRSKLVRLQNRDPYPSDENAEVLSLQQEHFQDYLLALQNELVKNQPPEGSVSRDRWQGEFGQTLRTIAQNARARGVNLPVMGSLFGFDRYREAIPMDSELTRLFPQLQGVAQLCKTLFEAGITELVSVEREQFELIPLAAVVDENESPRARRRRQAEEAEGASAAASSRDPFKDKDGLFSREHYALTFRAKDAAIWTVLSEFANQPKPFVVVTKLDILNSSRPAVQLPKAAEGAPEPQPRAPVSMDGFRAIGAPAPAAAAKEEGAPLPRELRVVAGTELSLVRIELDIYRFAGAPAAPAEEEEEAS